MSKDIAGYHMLMILSHVDGHFGAKEEKIIKKYLAEHFSAGDHLDKERDMLEKLPSADYPIRFNNAMNAFYIDSTPEERAHFLDFAVKMVIADKQITPRENLYLNELYNAWEANFSF